MKQILLFSTTILFLVLPHAIQASHIWGGEITYQDLGNDYYSIQMRLYRDCKGISYPNSLDVHLVSPNCGTQIMSLNQISVQDVTPNCPSYLNACQSAGFLEGIEEYVYKDIIQFTGCWSSTNDIFIYYKASSRGSFASNIGGSSIFYIDAKLNTSIDNSSPIFVNPINTYSNVSQPAKFNMGVYESDGDSLVYSLTACKVDSNSNCYYNTGYSPTSPLSTTSGFSINSATVKSIILQMF
jgi:hypothetical protein